MNLTPPPSQKSHAVRCMTIIIIINNSSGMRACSTFADAAVEENAPCKPHGTGQVQSILLRIITLGQLEPAKRAEPIEQVQHQRDHVHRQTDQDPQRVAERMQKRPEVRVFHSLHGTRNSQRRSNATYAVRQETLR